MAAHAIEAGAAGRGSSEFRFHVQPTGQRVQTDYYQMTDDFIIELIEHDLEPSMTTFVTAFMTDSHAD